MASEFEPIMKQEVLDAIISDRLKREREKTAEKYADYETTKSKVGEYEKLLADKDKELETQRAALSEKEKENEGYKATIQQYVRDTAKMRLVFDAGLPKGSERYIQGTTEEEIKASIAGFQDILKSNAPVAPLASSEPKQTPEGAKMNALKRLNESLHKE